MRSAQLVSLLLLAVFAASPYIVVIGRGYGYDSSVDFYTKECPFARSVVEATVNSAIRKDRGITAALIRLHFHDCFVRGCDASILLDSVNGTQAEKDSIVNANSIRTLSKLRWRSTARERSLVLTSWPSPQEMLSYRLEDPAGKSPPAAVMDWCQVQSSTLVSMFASKGLSYKEMVILSGAHTIGITHCGVIESRLYNSSGPNGVDPTLDANYAAQLKTECPFGSGRGNVIKMDPTFGGNVFDSNYFRNVKKNKGLFISDAALIANSRGKSFVQTEASGLISPFFQDFAAAMVKMSNIQVLKAPAGEIRGNCRVVNPNNH
ncbi:hypothetical protein R1sor_009390 [Riccia sorocarpa]|uniref:Peroxidase n=1 Tax=Riccia sorocarpa TaxID=122646 RepID=A0ABD3I150_9MARC